MEALKESLIEDLVLKSEQQEKINQSIIGALNRTVDRASANFDLITELNDMYKLLDRELTKLVLRVAELEYQDEVNKETIKELKEGKTV